jgi:hypothetical protein
MHLKTIALACALTAAACTATVKARTEQYGASGEQWGRSALELATRCKAGDQPACDATITAIHAHIDASRALQAPAQ